MSQNGHGELHKTKKSAYTMRYTEEQKQQAVDKFVELTKTMSMDAAAKEIGIRRNSLSKWKKLLSSNESTQKKSPQLLTMQIPSRHTKKVIVILGDPESVQSMLKSVLELME